MLRVLLRRRDYCRTMSKQFQQHKVGCQLWKWTRDTTRCFASKGGRCKSKECSSTVEENTSERKIALRETLSRISSTFGSETVMWLGRDDNTKEVPVISTGSLSLDAALGVGGLPKGRIVEIYGPEASGKTTLSLHVIAEAQKCGGQCLFIDAEHALDRSFAEALGVVTKDLLIAQPDSGEQALSLVDQFIRSRSVDVVVVDSVAALTPQAELDGEMGDAHMALQARLMSQALRKLTHNKSKIEFLWFWWPDRSNFWWQCLEVLCICSPQYT